MLIATVIKLKYDFETIKRLLVQKESFFNYTHNFFENSRGVFT